METLQSFLVLGTPFAYAIFLLSSFAILAAGVGVYLVVTPYPEIELIRRGNVAAAIVLGGVVVGLSLPLASILAHSSDIMTLLIWGGVGTVAQVVSWWLIGRLVLHLERTVPDGMLAPAIVSAAISISIGVVNAGALTY